MTDNARVEAAAQVLLELEGGFIGPWRKLAAAAIAAADRLSPAVNGSELQSIVETVGNQESSRERGCLSLRSERLLVQEIERLSRLSPDNAAAVEAERERCLAIVSAYLPKSIARHAATAAIRKGESR